MSFENWEPTNLTKQHLHEDRVPFLDLPAMHAPVLDDIQKSVEAVIKEHAFALGPAVERFERRFAEFVGVEHCVGVNSGTSALHVALLCAGVGPGDEVITTPMTWVSTAWAMPETVAPAP